MKPPTLENRLRQRIKPGNNYVVLYQKWRNLLFLHWEYDADEIQKRLPEGLYVDTFEEKAYIGITPFFMKDVRPRFAPAIPGISNFLETNFRTYVYDDNGNAGIWFFSLDANNPIAVITASSLVKLNYFNAEMFADISTEEIIDYSVLREDKPEELRSVFKYKKKNLLGEAVPGTLEFFMIERYSFFSSSEGSLYYGRVHHRPYILYGAEIDNWDDNLFEVNGFDKPKCPPDHVLFSDGIDVETYMIQKTK